MERGRVRVCDQAKNETAARGKRAQHLYQFTERLPEGVTPEQGRERVLAALGALLEGAR